MRRYLATTMRKLLFMMEREALLDAYAPKYN
jgi:hypothetical protein